MTLLHFSPVSSAPSPCPVSFSSLPMPRCVPVPSSHALSPRVCSLRICFFLGSRVALFLGGATYVWYTAATSLALTFAETADPNVNDQLLLMIPSAILLGVGAAVLWTAQGSYLTLCANELNLGMYNGVFFFLFIMNQLVGNVGAALILDIVDEVRDPLTTQRSRAATQFANGPIRPASVLLAVAGRGSCSTSWRALARSASSRSRSCVP